MVKIFFMIRPRVVLNEVFTLSGAGDPLLGAAGVKSVLFLPGRPRGAA
jgi:hypothetical protein